MGDIPASQPGLASLQMSQTASPLSPGRALGCRPRGEGSWLMGVSAGPPSVLKV